MRTKVCSRIINTTGFPVLLLLTSSLLPAGAQNPDDDFETFLFNLCQTTPDINKALFCANQLFPGGGAGVGGAGFASTGNFGSTTAQSRSSNIGATLHQENVEKRHQEPDDDARIQVNYASLGFVEVANDTPDGFNLFASYQTGETERDQSNLENGFESDLEGILVGGDYLLNRDFLLGLAIGTTDTDTDFDDSAGTLEIDAQNLFVYGTYAFSDNFFLNFNLGYIDSDLDSTRAISFGTVSGTGTGSTSSNQTIVGISTVYDHFTDTWSGTAFINVDYVETDIDGYTESGSTNLELIYPDQEVESLTTSIGVSASWFRDYSFGTVIPTAEIAYIHESEDDAREIDVATTLFPDDTFAINTDDPDRDYYRTLLGVSILGNSGLQFFAFYEQIGGHSFLDTWSISTGILVEL